MNKQKIFIIALASIVFLSLSAIIMRSNITSGNKTAKIYQNGKLIREIELDKLIEPIEFDITDNNGHTNTVRAERGKICMLHADCPDKVCVNQGYIQNGVIPIVCLPNKVTIEIVGAAQDIDGQTGGI